MQFYHPGSSSHSSHHPQQAQLHGYAPQTTEIVAPVHGQGQIISSSSSSSLSSMAAALVSGGPVLHHQIHRRHRDAIPSAPAANPPSANSRKSDSPPCHGQDSPISPAAMIGTGHENLMLPPPARNQIPPTGAPPGLTQPSNTTAQPTNTYGPYPASSTGQNQYHHHSKEGHLEWLKELNARAKAANHQNTAVSTNTTTMMAPGAAVVSMHQPPTVIGQHPTMAGVPPGTHVFHAGTYPSATAAAVAVAQNPMFYQVAMNHKFHMAAQSQGESEEKRARRLERNRESARKSRRRKKERLATLEAQVDRLHTHIEDERRSQVIAMCCTLKQVRMDEIPKLLNEFNENPEIMNADAGRQRLAIVLHSTSGTSQIAQSTIEFQYNILKQVLLPRYQKFLLWLTLHEEKFFTAGKDEFAKKDGKQASCWKI